MRVTRLEIFGFKSFVDRFVLNLDKNIIGVVGPNGCGKSNIVDALRWVLGETYARQLRGTVLDDLIFTGSDTRRPLGMAEVSITIRPDSDWTSTLSSVLAPVNGSETSPEARPATAPAGLVELTPADDGASPAERAEIVPQPDSNAELLSADAVLSAIDGGIDETTNIVPTLLREVPGLMGAAEIQFTRRMYRSGESEYFINRIPCRLRDMIDVYRLLGLGARGLSIVQQGEIGQLISKKPIERRELLEEAAGISGFRTRLESAEKKLQQTSDNMARLSDIIIEVEKQVRTLSRQAKRARERQELKAELEKWDLEVFFARAADLHQNREEATGRAESLTQQIEVLSAERARWEAELERVQGGLATVDAEVSEFRHELDKLHALRSARQDRVRQFEAEIQRGESRKRAIANGLAQLAERNRTGADEIIRREQAIAELQGRISAIDTARDQAEQQLFEVQERQAARLKEESERGEQVDESAVDAELRATIERLSAEIEGAKDIESRVRELEGKEREARREQDQQRSREQAERIRIASLESEIASLERQLAALADHVRKHTGAEAERSAADVIGGSANGSRVLIAGIRVPEKVQRALSAVMADRAFYLVTDDPIALGRQYAKSQAGQGKGKAAKLGVIGGFRSAHADKGVEDLSGFFQRLQEAVPDATPLLDQIEVADEVSEVTRGFLRSWVYVETLEAALQASELLRSYLNEAGGDVFSETIAFVTAKGEICTAWGWYTTEGEAGAVSFSRRVEELRGKANGIRETLAAIEQEGGKIQERLAEIREDISSAREVRDRLSSNQRELHSLLQRERQLERERREARARAERVQREQAMAEEREAQNKLRKVITERAMAEGAKEGERQRVESLRRELEALKVQEQSYLEEDRELAGRLEELRAEFADVSSGNTAEEGDFQSKASELSEQISELDRARIDLRSELNQTQRTISELRHESERKDNELRRASMEVERVSIERNMLAEELGRLYSEKELPDEEWITTFLGGLTQDIHAVISQAQEEAGRLRRRIEREGEVDPQSIEQFEQEDARLAGLRTQYADLEAASEALRQTTSKLKAISRERFLQTFAFVSKKFTEIIPRLFGGGAGHLELINPEDPLTSGVEIVVRPPGKKVSSMELLSGGEKALVAISLLVAMFLHRSSPICVLDEVDAPLDEANLDRFLSLIKEISATTQFLMITHNKQSMAASDRLVGITMEERGVSKALSVSFNEVEENLEQWVANA